MVAPARRTVQSAVVIIDLRPQVSSWFDRRWQGSPSLSGLHGQNVFCEGQMSEKLYFFLLKLYPDHFRRTYGDEALRLVRDRARSENGFLSGLRLWVDLLWDLAISLPREYGNTPTTPIVAAQLLNGERSFQLLAERSLNPALLCLAGTLSAAAFWVCLFAVGHSGGFPALFPAPLLPQDQSESALGQVRYPDEEESPIRGSARNLAASVSSGYSLSAGAHSFCMSAKQEIPSNSPHPLLAFHFARPGASGVALVDGKAVKIFRYEQRLSIRAHVLAGNHQFVLYLDRPAENTLMSSNGDLEYCEAK